MRNQRGETGWLLVVFLGVVGMVLALAGKGTVLAQLHALTLLAQGHP